jgi:glutaredoxin
VELFVTSWCGYCRRLEQFLDAKGVRYTRYDIEKDADARQRYQQLGVRGVPVTRVGAAVIIGYDPAAIITAVGK